MTYYIITVGADKSVFGNQHKSVCENAKTQTKVLYVNTRLSIGNRLHSLQIYVNLHKTLTTRTNINLDRLLLFDWSSDH